MFLIKKVAGACRSSLQKRQLIIIQSCCPLRLMPVPVSSPTVTIQKRNSSRSIASHAMIVTRALPLVQQLWKWQLFTIMKIASVEIYAQIMVQVLYQLTLQPCDSLSLAMVVSSPQVYGALLTPFLQMSSPPNANPSQLKAAGGSGVGCAMTPVCLHSAERK